MLTYHKGGLRVFVSGLFRAFAEGVGEGKGADSADIHVNGEHQFPHVGVLVDAAGGDAAGGEGGGGLEHGVFQRNLWVDDGQQDGGEDDEDEAHHDDGVGLIDDLGRNGFFTKFDFAFSTYGGEERLDDDEEGGGFDTASGGAWGGADKDNDDENEEGGNRNGVDVHNVEACCSARSDLEQRSEEFFETSAVGQSVLVL